MAAPLDQVVREVVREAIARRNLIVILFGALSLTILGLGTVWPKTYASSTTLYAEEQNVIAPLMEKIAPVTNEVKDRALIARQILFGRKILDQVAEHAGLTQPGSSDIEKERGALQVKGATVVRNVGKNLIKITFTNPDPVVTYKVTKKYAQAFIEENVALKKKNSREAYDFIDRQVQNYHKQLLAAEEKLKNYRTQHVVGTEALVNQRISDLRATLEETDLSISESHTMRDSLREQLQNESKLIKDDETQFDLIRNRIEAYQEQLDTLRLSYHDSYPDIVSLKVKIDELQQALQDQKDLRNEAERKNQALGNETNTVNPLYSQLRSEDARVTTEIEALKVRKQATHELLAKELERIKRIHETQATLSELTRDSEVNRQIYNDLLMRREKARVSMHLDMEGQGLSFKIQEPARLPLTPSGIRFIHFAMIGLVLGVIIPLGLVVAYVFVDPRLRTAPDLHEQTALPVLTTVPHVRTPYDKRMRRIGAARLGIIMGLLLVVYMSTTWLKVSGAL